MNAEDFKSPNPPCQRASWPPDQALLRRQQSLVAGGSACDSSAVESSRKLRVVTLGVYGSSEADFFGAVHAAGVDTFCDVRFRRGVRGSDYAFVNSRRLQARLAEMGIRYLHLRELAPSQALRDRQKAADKAERTTKRQRTLLSDLFITGYCEECLAAFDSRKFIEQLGSNARVVALFCVERAPAACHRSLLAERLHRDLGLEVVHLTPGETRCAS
jgi:uncharacterized protein (DUF488 family)